MIRVKAIIRGVAHAIWIPGERYWRSEPSTSELFGQVALMANAVADGITDAEVEERLSSVLSNFGKNQHGRVRRRALRVGVACTATRTADPASPRSCLGSGARREVRTRS